VAFSFDMQFIAMQTSDACGVYIVVGNAMFEDYIR